MISSVAFIITGIDGVVCNIDPCRRDQHVLAYQRKCDQELISFSDLPTGLFSRFSLGKVATGEYLRLVSSALAVPERVVAEAEYKVVHALNVELLTMLSDLAISIRVACAAESQPLQWERLKDVLPNDIFSNTFLSHETGKKPSDATLFKTILTATGARPDQILYMDANEYHLAAASKAGIKRSHLHIDNQTTFAWLLNSRSQFSNL